MAFMQPRDGETPLEVQDTGIWGEADKRWQELRDGETPLEVQDTQNWGEADKRWQELSSRSNAGVGQQELQTKLRVGGVTWLVTGF